MDDGIEGSEAGDEASGEMMMMDQGEQDENMEEGLVDSETTTVGGRNVVQVRSQNNVVEGMCSIFELYQFVRQLLVS